MDDIDGCGSESEIGLIKNNLNDAVEVEVVKEILNDAVEVSVFRS